MFKELIWLIGNTSLIKKGNEKMGKLNSYIKKLRKYDYSEVALFYRGNEVLLDIDSLEDYIEKNFKVEKILMNTYTFSFLNEFNDIIVLEAFC